MNQTYAFGEHASTDLQLAYLLAEVNAFEGGMTQCKISDWHYRFEGHCNIADFEEWAIAMLTVGYDSALLRELASATELERERSNRIFQAIIDDLGLSDLPDRILEWERLDVDAFLEGRVDFKSLVHICNYLDDWISWHRPAMDLRHGWPTCEALNAEAETLERDWRQQLIRDRELLDQNWEAARIRTRQMNANLWIEMRLPSERGNVKHTSYQDWAKSIVAIGFVSSSLNELINLSDSTEEQVTWKLYRQALHELNLSHIRHWPCEGETMDDLVIARSEADNWPSDLTEEIRQRLIKDEECCPPGVLV